MTELLRLAQIWEGKAHFFVSTEYFVSRQITNESTVYVVRKANRQKPLLLSYMLIQCARIMLKERPEVVISTGAAVGCILCILAKISRKKVVWIDSLAFMDELSLSGKIIRPFADLFLVQWPELAKRYNQVKYVGSDI